MPMRRPNMRIDLGVYLLIYEMLNVGLSKIPPVTLLTTIAQVLLYLRVICTPWRKWDVCISSEKLLKYRDFRSLIFSVFEHSDDIHLYYNMISYLVKGRSLENRYGSSNFFFFLAVISISTSVMYVAIGKTCAFALNNEIYIRQCTIGFSGVIFALKVVASCEEPDEATLLFGVLAPVCCAAWLEVLVIRLLVPETSYMAYVAGILVGILYCYTPIGFFIDFIISCVTEHLMKNSRSPSKRYVV